MSRKKKFLAKLRGAKKSVIFMTSALGAATSFLAEYVLQGVHVIAPYVSRDIIGYMTGAAFVIIGIARWVKENKPLEEKGARQKIDAPEDTEENQPPQ